MNYHIYAEGMIDSLKAENAALRAQLTAERAARERLVAELKSTAEQIEDEYNSDEFNGDLDSAEAMAELLWHIVRKMKATDQLAALDAPAVPTGPRIIAYGRTSKHFTLLWDDGERIEFQKGADGRWRNIGQPKREGA